MLKLTQNEVTRLQSASAAISELYEELDNTRQRFESEIAEIKSKIGEAKQDAWEVLDDAANQAESYYDERSEKWQEGDRGQAYSEWKDELRRLADECAEDDEDTEISVPDEPGFVGEIRDCEFSEFSF